jgi:RimJ/RimL family protein N-acetyltransferase
MTSDLEFSDGLVLIRPYRLDDADAIYEAVRESIPDLSPWVSWCHAYYSMEEAKFFLKAQAEWWKEGSVYNFAITDAEGGGFLGGCVLNRIDRTNRIANLSYWVRSSRTRQGVASAASLLAARFGFEELGLNRIEIVAATSNVARLRVAEKLSATREGILRNRITVRDKIYDAVMFSLIPEDLES